MVVAEWSWKSEEWSDLSEVGEWGTDGLGEESRGTELRWWTSGKGCLTSFPGEISDVV